MLLIVANVTAATAVLIMVYNILTHGENNAMQTDFSTRTIRMQTVLEKRQGGVQHEPSSS